MISFGGTPGQHVTVSLKFPTAVRPPRAISIADASAAENAGHLLFEVTLSRALQNTVKVDFETISGGNAYDDGQEVMDAVDELPSHPIASISAERLDAQLYHPGTTPVLVRCQWDRALPIDGMIPKSRAVPLLLEQEVPCWRWSERGETWETMLPYFLGRPHGRRSSLFVNQETGQTMKMVWNALINTGMFGPIMVDSAG